ncbi:MAG: hypothetical protein IH623_03460 [Verrucomicrobia bacterium]|nr:hypothetical protein [Verrucomicrobiota bacterium]
MKLTMNQSRVPVQLRKDLVAEVKSRLEPGMDFNMVYGQLLSRLEKSEQPSMEQAKLLLQNPAALLADHAERKAASREAQERLKVQVVNANIPKKAANRDQLVADTLGFVARFPMLTATEVKAVTLLRQENGNRDPQVIHTHEIASPDELADHLTSSQPLGAPLGRPGARFSASCQVFMLNDGEAMEHDPEAAPAHIPALEV